MAHKLAEYLQQHFLEWHVDCEYNLHGMDRKLLDGISHESECDEERTTDRIYPDIIMHIRNTDDLNILVIEIKTRDTSTICDEKKLKLLTGPKHKYRYQLGLLLKFNRKNEPKLTWYKNGKQKN